jgi:endonuclease YncB( thermonuclease family)
MATGTLEMLVKGKTVVCEPKTTDRYGRTVAICRADGEDLGRIMVQLGMAWAFVRYGRDYVDQEAQARAENLVCTDQWVGYNKLNAEYPHKSVDHSINQYVVGAVHTQTIEGFWSLVKRGMVGTFHKVSKK